MAVYVQQEKPTVDRLAMFVIVSLSLSFSLVSFSFLYRDSLIRQQMQDLQAQVGGERTKNEGGEKGREREEIPHCLRWGVVSVRVCGYRCIICLREIFSSSSSCNPPPRVGFQSLLSLFLTRALARGCPVSTCLCTRTTSRPRDGDGEKRARLLRRCIIHRQREGERQSRRACLCWAPVSELFIGRAVWGGGSASSVVFSKKSTEPERPRRCSGKENHFFSFSLSRETKILRSEEGSPFLLFSSLSFISSNVAKACSLKS